MSTCVPIKELKNTSEFTNLVQNADDAITVTKNGYDTLVVMTPEKYEALKLEAARAKLYQIIDQSEQEIATGNTVDANDSLKKTRLNYGL